MEEPEAQDVWGLALGHLASTQKGQALTPGPWAPNTVLVPPPKPPVCGPLLPFQWWLEGRRCFLLSQLRGALVPQPGGHLLGKVVTVSREPSPPELQGVSQ